LTTLRPTASLWRRARATLLAGSLALGTILAPAGVALADDTGAVSASDGTGGSGFVWDGASRIDATAVVATDDGGNLNLRAEPAADADVLASIPKGTRVDLRIDVTDTVADPDGATRWWPVSFGGQDGWVSGQFLTSASAPAAAATTPAAPRGPFAWTGDSLEGATATVAGDGQNVNVRAEPAADAAIVTKVADGALVNLRIDRVDTVVAGDTRWWPVEVNGEAGWISGDLLTDSGSSIFPAGSTALVQTQSGRGVKLRAGAGRDAEQIGSIPERSTVTVVSGPSSHDASANGWFEIEFNGQRGFVDGDLLVLIATPTAAAPGASSSGQAGATQPSDGTDANGQQPAATAPAQPGETATAGATQTPVAGATEPAETGATEPAETATSAARPWETTQTPAVTETATAAPATETPTPRPTQPPANSAAGFIMPVDGAVQTQGFGCSSLGFYAYNPDWGCGVHDGIDFAAPSYTPIHAVADGTVVTAGWCDCGLGYYVEIDHGGGSHPRYGHMATQPYVSAGQKVTQGQEIGPVGSTGLSTGPHTHFMVQVNGVSQDPARYLP
jgi:murein DD-endopeptidase MepM/ murein hydrolase activator NlpD